MISNDGKFIGLGRRAFLIRRPRRGGGGLTGHTARVNVRVDLRGDLVEVENILGCAHIVPGGRQGTTDGAGEIFRAVHAHGKQLRLLSFAKGFPPNICLGQVVLLAGDGGTVVRGAQGGITEAILHAYVVEKHSGRIAIIDVDLMSDLLRLARDDPVPPNAWVQLKRFAGLDRDAVVRATSPGCRGGRGVFDGVVVMGLGAHVDDRDNRVIGSVRNAESADAAYEAGQSRNEARGVHFESTLFQIERLFASSKESAEIDCSLQRMNGIRIASVCG